MSLEKSRRFTPMVVGVARKGLLRRPRKLARLLRERRYRAALRLGVAATTEHEDVAFAHDYASIIDVGAHRGQFALLVWKRFPQAELFCVEPLPVAVAQLRRVLARHPKATILPVAAAKASGTAQYHVSRLTDSSSLLAIERAYVTAFPGTEEAGLTEVRTAPLDELVDRMRLMRPCLLKIDTQGSELDVLRGAKRLLAAIDEVFVECSFVEFYKDQALIDDVIDHLHQNGFRLSGIYSVVRDGTGRCLQADLLFGRRGDQ